MKKISSKALLLAALTILSCLVITGCDEDDADHVISSGGVYTGEIYATIDVYSDEANKAYASVQLTKDGAPREDKPGDEYIQLNADDQLWMTTGVDLEAVDIGNDLFSGLVDLNKIQELFEEELRGFRLVNFFFFWSFLLPTQVHYNGHLNDVEDGSTFTVSLFRDVEMDAKESVVTMPLAYDLTAPLATDDISRSSDTIQVEWQPIENDVAVKASFNTSCPSTSQGDVVIEVEQDNGVLVVDPGALASEALSGDCNTTLTLTKYRVGLLDSQYVGGYISGNQVRSISFRTTD